MHLWGALSTQFYFCSIEVRYTVDCSIHENGLFLLLILKEN